MNTETGEIYRTPEEIKAAIAKYGPDKVVPVSEKVAKLMLVGQRAQSAIVAREFSKAVKPSPARRPLFKTRTKRSR